MNTFLVLLGLYLVSVLLIGWWTSRKESDEEYLIAGRDRPWWQVLCSKYAASVGAGFLLTNTAFFYEYGFPVTLTYVGLIVGTIMYAYWAGPIIHRISQTYKCYTQGDFVLALTQSEFSKKLINLASAGLALLILAVAVVGGATVMEELGVLTYEKAVAATLGVVLVYVYFSGYKAVLITDVLQAVLMVGLLALVVFSIVSLHPFSPAELTESRGLSVLGITMIAAYGLISVFSYPDRYQVTYATKTIQALKRGMTAVLVPIALTSMGLFLIATAVYSVDPSLSSSDVYVTAIRDFLPSSQLPYALVIFFANGTSSSFVPAAEKPIFPNSAVNMQEVTILGPTAPVTGSGLTPA